MLFCFCFFSIEALYLDTFGVVSLSITIYNTDTTELMANHTTILDSIIKYTAIPVTLQLYNYPVILQECFVCNTGMAFAPRETLGSKMQTKRSSWTPLNHHLSNSHVRSSDHS